MKQLRLPIFTTKIKFYSLRIIPPEPIIDRIKTLKERFEFAYGKQPLSRSKPNVTLAHFRMNTKHQDVLLKALEQLSKSTSFELQIAGFDVFEETNTLCLKVQKTKALSGLHNQIQGLVNGKLKGKLKSFSLSEEPHITISKTTGPRMRVESLQYFKKNDYADQFVVDHLTLVSRSKYKIWDWEHEIKLS